MADSIFAAVLAGGASSRMGLDKALLEVDGQAAVNRTGDLLAALFPAIVVITASSAVRSACKFPCIPDQHAGLGPLAGIEAALNHFQAPVFVVACDMPCLDPGLIAGLIARWQSGPQLTALAPRHAGGWEPLHAIYSPRLLPRISALLRSATETGNRLCGLNRLLSEWGAGEFDEADIRRHSPGLQAFENWNYPGDVKLPGADG